MSYINTTYMYDNLQLNWMKISDLTSTNYNPNAEKIIYNSMDDSNTLSSMSADFFDFGNTIGYLQTANNALNNISDEVELLSKLSQNQNNPSLNEQQKNQLKIQMQQLQKEIAYTLNNTTYNGSLVFNQEYKIGNKNINLDLNPNMMDVSNPNTILEFQKALTNIQKDIGEFMNNSLNTQNIFSNNYSEMGLLSEVDKYDLDITADLIAQAHNQDYLSNRIDELLQIS